MHVLLLSGGKSAERKVSLRSGAAVKEALLEAGHTVTEADPATTLDDALLTSADVVFPALHGIGGEDGLLQERLEALGQPFVGAGSQASKLCFNKWQYRQHMIQHGIQVADGELVDEQGFLQSSLSHGPFVLKPYGGGSSIDTIISRTGDADTKIVTAAFSRNPRMLLETLIEGIEITVGVVGSTALPVVEIVPPADAEFDYENKYNGRTGEYCPPQTVDAAVQSKAQALAERIHTLTGCRGMSRTDMIVTPAGELYVLETNTLPGMTTQSLLPKAAAVAGMSMPQLVDRLLQLAVQPTA